MKFPWTGVGRTGRLGLQSGPQVTSGTQPMITMALLHAMSFLSVCSAAQGQMSGKTVLDRDSKGAAGRMSRDVGRRLMDVPSYAELAR